MDEAEEKLLKEWPEPDHDELDSINRYGGRMLSSDIVRLFGISQQVVSTHTRTGRLNRFREDGRQDGRFVYDPKQVVNSILEGAILCRFMAKDASDDESMEWAYAAFTKTILRAGRCPSGAALRLWLDAANGKVGSDRLMKWKFGVARKPKKANENGNSTDSDPVVVAEHGNSGPDTDRAQEVPDEEIDEDAARIDEQIDRAKKSGKIAAPYLKQDPEKNRREREAPIVIPNLEDC